MPAWLWITDVHFDFVPEGRRRRFVQSLAEQRPEAVLLGGDIAQADSFADYLRELGDAVAAPIYFVLGNHDYYRGSIAAVRKQARALHHENAQLVWLPAAGVAALSKTTALIGHGGWGDARAGDYDATTIVLNDYLLIEDLRQTFHDSPPTLPPPLDPRAILTDRLREKLEQLGDEAAAHLRHTAAEALTWAKEVVVLMHVPPFREACWYQGRTSDDNWAPHFVCAAAGQALREVMQSHPEQQMTVLCGHTHNPGRAEILPNLTVLTGGAEYGEPSIQTAWP